MPEDLELHQKYINRAMELAARGEGMVEPNPMVGAVIVRDDKVISEGWHEHFGGPHAEINAFNNTKESVEGATLYINIEPCAHFGKTPPCVDAIIKAKIGKVVFSVRDPNPVTAGKGVTILRNAGIDVVEGIGERKARLLNAPFFKLHTEGLPYFIAKWAMTVDGKTATRSGDSKWISSEESRSFSHEFREKMGAIMVGIGTILKDNPKLLGREGAKNNPRRIILDSFARLPPDSEIVKTLKQAETHVVISPNAPQEKVKQLFELGVKIFEIEEVSGKINFLKLARKLTELGINKVLIEGGGEVLASAFEADLVDEVMVFIAPKIIGGRDAKTPVAGEGLDILKNAFTLADPEVRLIGNDILVRSRINRR
ncbi:MAG: bifunctional diaminohydroxyphosphoribosylaminopyrimidine deaminase/5-amino-6-(5-phosphoribosylamino)uracil reductase RibD [Planctomycetes bacterium]|nr:bifunctional diaminohydroxyphosphoribosylaminopyrimidine deaminase/5-amino-6-(5-phosphoribosylamino)uracil reductase RibD [Planctomycetota bacterium]